MVERSGGVIIIDSDRRIRTGLRTLLTAAGLPVSAEVESVEVARHVVRRSRPTVAVVDPACSTSAVACDLIRWLSRDLGVPVVALTSDPGLRDVAIEAGAGVVLTKDCEPENLIVAVGGHLPVRPMPSTT